MDIKDGKMYLVNYNFAKAPSKKWIPPLCQRRRYPFLTCRLFFKNVCFAVQYVKTNVFSSPSPTRVNLYRRWNALHPRDKLS